MYKHIIKLCIIYITAIAIDLRLCNSTERYLQQASAGVTMCSTYDQNLITLLAEVCDIVLSLYGLVNNQ